MDGRAFSPDGRFLVFGSIGAGIFWARADGGGRVEPLLPSASKAIVFPTSFTSDGSRLVYYEVEATPQIWTVPIDPNEGIKAGKPERYLTSRFVDSLPTFSPDGRWIAYQSNEAGKEEVYVRPFPMGASGQGGKWQISTNGGRSPRWSPNGREILYLSGEQVMSVDYTAHADAFVPGKPRVWLAKLGSIVEFEAFDLAPDGKHVVTLAPTTSAGPAQPEHSVMLLQNFFDELRRRVPVGR